MKIHHHKQKKHEQPDSA